MTFWCAGYRNVTAAYGVECLTEDHLAAFKRCGVKRALIAFDSDEAGERGAEKAAERLMAEGLECYRIQFLKGMEWTPTAPGAAPAADIAAEVSDAGVKSCPTPGSSLACCPDPVDDLASSDDGNALMAADCSRCLRSPVTISPALAATATAMT